MDLRQLRYFVAIAEAGSLSAAADGLGVAQSALSRHLAGLEHGLGARLFDRGRRGVSPTGAGALLLGRARAILAEIEATRAELTAGRGSCAGGWRLPRRPRSPTRSMALWRFGCRASIRS